MGIKEGPNFAKPLSKLPLLRKSSLLVISQDVPVVHSPVTVKRLSCRHSLSRSIDCGLGELTINLESVHILHKADYFFFGSAFSPLAEVLEASGGGQLRKTLGRSKHLTVTDLPSMLKAARHDCCAFEAHVTAEAVHVLGCSLAFLTAHDVTNNGQLSKEVAGSRHFIMQSLNDSGVSVHQLISTPLHPFSERPKLFFYLSNHLLRRKVTLLVRFVERRRHVLLNEGLSSFFGVVISFQFINLCLNLIVVRKDLVRFKLPTRDAELAVLEEQLTNHLVSDCILVNLLDR